MDFRLGDHRIGWREWLGLTGAIGFCLVLWAMVFLVFCIGGNH